MAIWGCGPVGILAAHAADFRGAERIVIIDNQQYRLDFAKKHIPRIETINFDEHKNVRRPALPASHRPLLVNALRGQSACMSFRHA